MLQTLTSPTKREYCYSGWWLEERILIGWVFTKVQNSMPKNMVLDKTRHYCVVLNKSVKKVNNCRQTRINWIGSISQRKQICFHAKGDARKCSNYLLSDQNAWTLTTKKTQLKLRKNSLCLVCPVKVQHPLADLLAGIGNGNINGFTRVRACFSLGKVGRKEPIHILNMEYIKRYYFTSLSSASTGGT